jgi:hypothetical protein
LGLVFDFGMVGVMFDTAAVGCPAPCGFLQGAGLGFGKEWLTVTSFWANQI